MRDETLLTAQKAVSVRYRVGVRFQAMLKYNAFGLTPGSHRQSTPRRRFIAAFTTFYADQAIFAATRGCPADRIVRASGFKLRAQYGNLARWHPS